MVRLKLGDMDKGTMTELGMINKTLLPDHPMDNYFVKSKNNVSYEAKNKWRQIITFATIITVFISCIGLLGLTLLSVRKRIKEIGVRKILGPTEWQVVILLAKNFVGLVWLESFPYRISLHGWVFVVTAALIFLIALLTVSLQAFRAANSNPVNSLRSE
jgi:putative ABC transport system permease protein